MSHSSSNGSGRIGVIVLCCGLKRVFTQGFKEGGMPRIDSRIVVLVLLAIIGVPHSGLAGMRQCARHALNREEASAAEAAARAALPHSVHLFIAGACWNPDTAATLIESRRSTQRDGVK